MAINALFTGNINLRQTGIFLQQSYELSGSKYLCDLVSSALSSYGIRVFSCLIDFSSIVTSLDTTESQMYDYISIIDNDSWFGPQSVPSIYSEALSTTAQ